MNIKPVSGPNQIPMTTTNNTDARARAMAVLTGSNQQPATHVVQNQNAISAEEMGAVKAPSQAPETEATEDTLTPPAVPEPNHSETPDSSATSKEDPALSRQFAQLARQERAMRTRQQQQEQAFKAKEAALAEREASIAKRDQETRDGYISRDQLKSQTLQTLIESGISYDDLTQQLLNSSAPLDPRIEAQLQKQSTEIQRLQKLIDERDNSAKQQQQTQYDAAVKQIRQDAQTLVKNDPNYESIKATGSVNDVVDLIVQTFNEDGTLMSVEEAAEEVENYLVEEALKLSRLSKVQKRLSATVKPTTPTAPVTTPAQTQAQPSKPTMKTLTNATGSTRPLSAKERAILAFKGELK